MLRRPRSIRWWLTTFTLATVLPLVILLTWLFVSQVRREELDARDTALRVARATATRLGTSYQESVSLLEHLASRRAIRDFDGRRCDELFAVVDFFPQYADLFFFDSSGALACAAEPSPRDRPISAEARRWIASEIGAGRLRPRHPLLRRIAGHWVSAVALDVHAAGGEAKGMLVVIDLLDMLGPDAVSANAVITVMDGNGVVLARTSEAERWVGRNIIGRGVAATALREREGRTAAIGIDGISRQYGFTDLPDLGWYVYVGVPTAEVMQPVRATFLRGVFGGAAIVLLVGVAGAMLARALAGPINALVGATQSVAAGAYGRVDVGHGPLEITTLAETFNEMVVSRAEAEKKMAESQRDLKALSDRLLVIQEQERTRIAREIHDDLGQSLTALKMDVLGLVAAARPESSPLRSRVVSTIDSIVVAVQRIAAELRPSLLDDLGLVAALESEARLFEERTGIECELSLPDELQLEPARAGAIYRIIQEALTNVARHSDATRVELRLRFHRGDLLIDIRDDGRGITDDQLNDPDSLGLVGMRERASLVGGTVTVEGVPGRGTIVSVCIPLTANERIQE